MHALFVLAFVAALIALAMLGMAVGVLWRRPCLRGSCGGAEVRAADGTPLSCRACPKRKIYAPRLRTRDTDAPATSGRGTTFT